MDKDDVEGGMLRPIAVSSMNKENKMKCAGCCCFFVGIPAFVGFIILMCSITKLGPEEQLVIVTDGGVGKETINGPTTTLVSPFRESKTRDATRLSPKQYAIVMNTRTGIRRHESGPMLLWLGAWDELKGVKQKTVLMSNEFIRLKDSYTGLIRVERGAKSIVPGVWESSKDGIEEAKLVTSLQSVVVLNRTSGKKRSVRQEGRFVPDPVEDVITVRNATILKKMDYAIVRNMQVGEYRHEEGPKNLFVDAYDEIIKVRPKIVLQKHEYVRFVDRYTGIARVVVGPTLLVPEPAEDGPGGIVHNVQKAIVITSQTSVILFNSTSGKKYEMRTEGIFVPGPYENVLEVRKATVLKSQEYAVVKDTMTGKYLHYAGPQQLFVGPYEQLMHVLLKVVIQKKEYLRLVDRRSGEENVEKGPQAVVPQPTECEKDYVKNCTLTVQQAIVMKADTSVLTLNTTTGVKSIIRADSGGIFTPAPYEDILEIRKATVLKQLEYAVIKNTWNGNYSHAEGPVLLHLEAYEELIRVDTKVVLQKFEYVRLVNELTGIERIVEGPEVFVPDPPEVSVKGELQNKDHANMVQHAILVDRDHALLVLNHLTGLQSLVQTDGMWIPAPYEHFVERRPLVRVMANQAVVVRDDMGSLTIYDGTSGGAGTAFFLPARSEIMKMRWSSYSMPDKEGKSNLTFSEFEKIDMRIQRTYYSYVVRTNDNVELMVMGTIFWRVENVTKMVLETSDPSADVWQKSRSSLMQAVSNRTFDAFMGSFNTMAREAYSRDVSDGFYYERGLALLSLEVTRFEAVDEETKATLMSINEETTKQITLLKKQEGENAIRLAKMRADITLQEEETSLQQSTQLKKQESDNAVRLAKMRADIILEEEQTSSQLRLEGAKTSLIQTRIGNELIEKKAAAEGASQPYAQHAATFVSALNDTGVSIAKGVELYRILKEAEHHNKDTANLAGGKATLFLTSNDVKLNLRNLNLGQGLNDTEGAHDHEL